MTQALIRKMEYMKNLEKEIENEKITAERYNNRFKQGYMSSTHSIGTIKDENKLDDEFTKTNEAYSKLNGIVKRQDLQEFLSYLKKNNFLNLFSIYSDDFIKLLKGAKALSIIKV